LTEIEYCYMINKLNRQHQVFLHPGPEDLAGD
jgi:hypothetical protein